MSKPEQFSIRLVPSLDGHWWEVRDEARALRAQGFSSGRKFWARQDARDAIARLQRTSAPKAVAA